MIRRFSSSAVFFVFFAMCYGLPFVLDASVVEIKEGRVEQLLTELLSSLLVWQELLRNGMALLALLFCVHLVCGWVAVQLACKMELSVFFLRLLLLFVAWLALMSVNAWLFPLSNYTVAFQSVVGPFWIAAFLILMFLAISIAFTLRRFFLVSLAGLSLAGLVGFGWQSVQMHEIAQPVGGRNVILIGVDSLSADVFEKNPTLLPSLTNLMGHATRYSRAYTPLGRTFPAWVSILSGKLPAEHGAVFNLRNLGYVDRQDLLTSTLQRMGYRTVFAIDERRFANIDESFGFDQVVGPKAGALDFALQGLNDNPLSNLLLQTPLAAYLFPYSYINAAAHSNYSADGFVERVLGSVKGGQSLFMAVHFESAHFPFRSRHAEVEVRRDNRFMGEHLRALTVVDRQVAQLLEGLRVRGVLDDALVILLSDHGESLGDLEASLVRDGKPFEVRGFGHGVNLLSDRQNRILLGKLIFRGGRPVSASGDDARQVSLLALRPAIEAFARGGESVFPKLGECLVVETGFRMGAALDYRSLKEGDVAKQAAVFYELDLLGRLRFREERLPELLEKKDIGWRCEDQLTWYESATQNYLAYKLDARGIPVEQLIPSADAIARIQAYRQRYLK